MIFLFTKNKIKHDFLFTEDKNRHDIFIYNK